MDERAVTNVLAECGNNIDAAIKRLGELRLSVGNPAAAGQQEAPPSTPPPVTSQAAAAAAAAAEAAEAAAAPGGPTTAEQWVEVLVGEMSAARDLGDARTRAAGFLRQFEAFVARYVRQQQQQQGASTSAASPEPGAGGVSPGPGAAAAAAGGASAAHQSVAQRAAKLAEENALLKKAVQIQHRQLQEKSAAEGEVASLKAMLAQYQEQVRTLQLTNYSLSLHLQKATNSDALGHHHRGGPDVF
ncbi:hypothetical protein HYH02_012523 [Chlamydomonas schloesseri]|uniref:UBA domain-containing protein n=1 Tax=Chlamydomonas schloesseri TaxID=2026947 RepID=A0A835SY43_9CHLO|nr:hypothetical protein HYH02_012523 [Chlamydomonas schloesseri]|eukprot:KAG2433592.1 hypothetical protein HYH02_012523 [Chlamydomonas schloesseri]